MRATAEQVTQWSWGALSVMVIVIGNGIGNSSSNPGWSFFAFHFTLMPFEKVMNPSVQIFQFSRSAV